jgi:DNA invertase Pin-like site-specific DNA recombinase
VFGALAQFERDLIRERTRAGLVALSLETDEADASQSSPTKNFIALAR